MNRYICLFLLFLGCTPSPSAPTSIPRTRTPAALTTTPLTPHDFHKLSTLYLLAANNHNPFSHPYNKSAGQYFSVPPAIIQSITQLITYLRQGAGLSIATVNAHFEQYKKAAGYIFGAHQPLQDFPAIASFGSLAQEGHQCTFVTPPYLLNYHSSCHEQDLQNSTISLQTLLLQRCQSTPPTTNHHQSPIENHLYFEQGSPSNLLLNIPNALKKASISVTIPPTLTLPATCMAQARDQRYQLMGAFQVGQPSQLITYFRWNQQWFKITAQQPTPQKVRDSEPLHANDGSSQWGDFFSYLYEKEPG